MVSSHSYIVNFYCQSTLSKCVFQIQNCLTNCPVSYETTLWLNVIQDQLREAVNHRSWMTKY